MHGEFKDLFHVLETGAIVAFSRELNALISTDGNFYNLWIGHVDGWLKVDFKIIEGGVEQLTVVSDLILKAEMYLDDYHMKISA